MDRRISVTTGMKKEIIALQVKTGWKFPSLIKWAKQQGLTKKSIYLSEKTMYAFISGKIKTIHFIDYLILKEAYESLPEELWKPYEPPNSRPADWKEHGEITQPIRAKLKAEIERTGIGAPRFMNEAENIPSDLTERRLHNIIYSKNVRYFKSGEMKYILEQYASFPTENMPITAEMRKELIAEIERSGVTTVGALAAFPSKPLKFRAAAMQPILKGKIPGTMNEGHWNWLTAALLNLPDKGDEEKPQKPIRPKRTTGGPLQKSGKSRSDILLEEPMVLQIQAELDRTGISLKALAAQVEGIRAATISRWKNGKSSSVCPKDWSDVMEVLLRLPDQVESSKNIYRSGRGVPFPEIERPKKPYFAPKNPSGK